MGNESLSYRQEPKDIGSTLCSTHNEKHDTAKTE